MFDRYLVKYILCGLLFSCHVSLFAQFSQEQLQWLESEQEHPEQTVNEGELKFISASPNKPEHRQSMQIIITEETIASGWAVVSQCHENLDRVGKLEIVFHRERVRSLQVIEYANIERAWSKGHRVIVRNVQQGSRICLRAESLIFRPREDQAGHPQFEMVNGPFMRRFLDGYYPLTLSLLVSYPHNRLQFVNAQPEEQPGWEIRYDAGRISLGGRFEGKLSTRLRFALIK